MRSLKLGTRQTDWMDLKGIDWQVVILGKISSRQEAHCCLWIRMLAFILRYPEYRSKVAMTNFLLLLSPARLECHLVQLNLPAWSIQLVFSAKEVIVNLEITGIPPDCCCLSRPPSAFHFWPFLIVYLCVLDLINTNWLSKMQLNAWCSLCRPLTGTGCIKYLCLHIKHLSLIVSAPWGGQSHCSQDARTRAWQQLASMHTCKLNS